MDTTFLSSTYGNEAGRVSSDAWVVSLMKEIDDNLIHPSAFDDFYREDIDCQSSDESRIHTFAQVGASASAAGDADVELVRLASMAPGHSVVGQMPLVDMEQKQSWESPCRESLLLAARDPAAVVLPLERGPTTTDVTATASSTAAADEKQVSRKRKATPSKSVNRRKRQVESTSQSSPSPETEDVGADVIDVAEEDIRDDDILKGRGGLSNRHVGNKRFRRIVADMKEMYRKMCLKTDKTALSRAIVEYIHAKGGRFLIKETNGQAGWRVMTKAEAQKKTSQALRETKELKWTLSPSESPTQKPTRAV